MTVQSPVVSYSVFGPWHKGPPPPNGCVDGQRERSFWTYEVYSADYYGNGSKLYMWCREYLQTEYSSTLVGISNDGSIHYIMRTLERHGVRI